MAPQYDTELPRREREVMDILHVTGSATVQEVGASMSGSFSDSTVRTWLSRLESRGYIRARKNGRSLVYSPAKRTRSVAAEALDRVLRIFFQGALSNAVSLHMRAKGRKLTPQQLEQLQILLGEDEKRDPEDRP